MFDLTPTAPVSVAQGLPIPRSRVATVLPVPTIPQKELRNNSGEILRRAEAGEEFTITVSGRPVAKLGPIYDRRWVPSSELKELWELPPDPDYMRDIETADFGDLRDPWAEEDEAE